MTDNEKNTNDNNNDDNYNFLRSQTLYKSNDIETVLQQGVFSGRTFFIFLRN